MKIGVSNEAIAGVLVKLIECNVPEFKVWDDRGGTGGWIIKFPGRVGLPHQLCDALAPFDPNYYV